MLLVVYVFQQLLLGNGGNKFATISMLAACVMLSGCSASAALLVRNVTVQKGGVRSRQSR
jgi:hypothetical protein